MLQIIHSLSTISCLSSGSKHVDWFFQIKGNSGFKAYYLDTGSRTAFKSVPDMDTTNDPVGVTLKQVFSAKNVYVTIFNDNTSDGKGGQQYAHQKGVIAFDLDSKTGIYLQHSTPQWPPKLKSGYKYKNDDFGQHFTCINIDQAQLEVIGRALFVSRPLVYENTFDMNWLSSKAPSLFQTLQGKYNNIAQATQSILKSRSGQKFDIFYKNKQADIDIWGELIAPQKKSDMFVETWLRDKKAKPFCSGYKVEMVETVNFLGQQWKETTDHAKWGVSSSGRFVCTSDINFMKSQEERGGGAICLDDPAVASAFKKSIVNLDPDLSC